MAQQEVTDELQNALINTYQQNLYLLSVLDKELFYRITHLSNQINIGEYKERYFLELITDDYEFDIFDSFENKFIYNKQPKKFIDNATKQIQFDTLNTITPLNADYYNFSELQNLSIEGDNSIFSVNGKKTLKHINEFKKVINCKISSEKTSINMINKFMFIGTLTGRHILPIMNKVKAKSYFICESNLEIFRLSLFTCDYVAFLDNKAQISFSIMDDDHILSEKFTNFFNLNVYDNSLIKYYSTNYNVKNLFDRIIDRILSLSPLKFDYNMHLKLLESYSLNFFQYKTLNLAKSINFDFEDIPVLYLGAGPSLHSNIQWIKENQDKFIIVTMAATLTLLFENDIQPDIITTLDPQIIVQNQFYSHPNAKKYLKNAIVLASINTHQSVLANLNQDTNLFLYEVLNTIQKNNMRIMGISVGEITMDILNKLFSLNSLYLLGVDFSINQKTGKSHYDQYAYDNSFNLNDLDLNKVADRFDLRNDLVTTKGNQMDIVFTSRLFYASLKYFDEKTSQSNFHIFNLSDSGSYIQNTKPLNIFLLEMAEFSNLSKSKIKDDILSDLNNITAKFFTKEETSSLISYQKQFDEIIELITSIKEIQSIEDLKILSTKLFQIIDNYSTNGINFFHEIYISYTLIMNLYLEYCCLINKKQPTKKQLAHIYDIWKKQLLEIIEEHNNYLNRFN